MKVVSNDGLTKLVELVKDNFIKNTDVEATGEVTLATVATSGQYSDLTGTPTIDQTYNASSTNSQSGTAVAQAVGSVLPTQSGQSGKFLTTNGSAASWASLPEVDQTYDGTSTNAQSGTAVKEALEPAYKIAGRMNFSSLPQILTEDMIGNVYSINDPFTTDNRFVASGKPYSEGTNVVVIETVEDVTYYGFYSYDTGQTIYTLTNPYSLSSGDSVYNSVEGGMVVIGYVDTYDCYEDEYSTIYSWRDNSEEYHYDYSGYNSAYNISVPGTTPTYKYDPLSGVNNAASINPSDNYVPYRSSSTAFSDSTLLYNSNAMAFNGKLHVGSSNPATYASKGKLTIYDNTPSQQVSSIALLNYGGGGGCGVAIDMYNTNANGGIPSGRFGVVDNGNYSGYLQLQVKKSGGPNNPLLPAMNIVPVPAANSLTTCVSFGQDEFNRVLFDLHRPEATTTITDSDKRWSGSGTTYSVTGSNKFNSRLLVAVGDIVSFNNFTTEATVTAIVSSDSQLQITTDKTLGTISNQNITVKKAYFKITDENNNIKLYVDPYGKMGIGTGTPDYELDVVGSINASTDVKINGVSVTLPSQTSQSGKFLTTNGSTASWADIPTELPSQSGQSGKVLTTNGTAVSWTSLPTVDQTYDGTSTNAQSGTAVKSAIDTALSSVYKPAGSVAFANLPTPASTNVGNVYNMTDAFTTDRRFVEGAGKEYPASTNVVIVDTGSSTYMFDVLAGFIDLSGYQPVSTAVTHTASTAVGNSTTPVYIASDGTAITIGYTIEKSVPSDAVFTDTTYSQGTGISINGTTINHSNSVTAGTAGTSSATSGSTLAVPYITYDAQGHITATGTHTHTITGFLTQNDVTSTYSATGTDPVNGTAVASAISNKVDGNTAITGATKCKITYDSKGLVTAGTDLSASDIPDLSSTYQTKITSSAKLSADLISDGTTNKTVTATEKSTWSGKQDALVSGTNIKTINNTSILGSGNIDTHELPSQSGQNGKFLITNGTSASWADIPAVATFYWGE